MQAFRKCPILYEPSFLWSCTNTEIFTWESSEDYFCIFVNSNYIAPASSSLHSQKTPKTKHALYLIIETFLLKLSIFVNTSKVWKHVLTLHNSSFSLYQMHHLTIFFTMNTHHFLSLHIKRYTYSYFIKGFSSRICRLKEVWNKIIFSFYSRLDSPLRPPWLFSFGAEH